jgi:hypothetical protein
MGEEVKKLLLLPTEANQDSRCCIDKDGYRITDMVKEGVIERLRAQRVRRVQQCGDSSRSFSGFALKGPILRGEYGPDDQPPVVRPPFKFLHADTLTGAKVRVSGAGDRYPSALCGRCVL